MTYRSKVSFELPKDMLTITAYRANEDPPAWDTSFTDSSNKTMLMKAYMFRGLTVMPKLRLKMLFQ